MKPKIQTKNGSTLGLSLRIAAVVAGASLVCGIAQAAPDDAAADTMVPASNDEPGQVSGAAGYQYLWLAGSVFHPFQTGAAFAYSGAGCIHLTGGTERRFVHKFLLPKGSLVKYVRLYSYDNSASSQITVLFTTYDAAGNYSEINLVSSTNAGGYVSDLGPEMNYFVNGLVEPVNIVANLGTQNDINLQFCGVRVAYIPDLIFANGFE